MALSRGMRVQTADPSDFFVGRKFFENTNSDISHPFKKPSMGLLCFCLLFLVGTVTHAFDNRIYPSEMEEVSLMLLLYFLRALTLFNSLPPASFPSQRKSFLQGVCDVSHRCT